MPDTGETGHYLKDDAPYHQSTTWDHPFMWDSQMVKPCNKVNPFHSILHISLMKHVRATSCLASYTVHLSQLASYGVLDAQMC